MRLRHTSVLLLAGLLIPASWGVSQKPKRPPKMAPPAAGNSQHGDSKTTGERIPPPGFPPGRPLGPGGPGGHRGFPPLFEQLAKLPPEERMKALENDPRFKRMPPERQAQIRQNLERYTAMTPEQQQLFQDRFDILNNMPLQNRDRIREVFPRWRQLPADRRQAMHTEFQSLSAMSPADREKRFADPEFQKTYSPKEQQLLKDLAGLLK